MLPRKPQDKQCPQHVRQQVRNVELTAAGCSTGKPWTGGAHLCRPCCLPDLSLCWAPLPQSIQSLGLFKTGTPAGVAKWVEHQPVTERGTGLYPVRAMTGLQVRSPVVGTRESTTHCYFSPSLSPFFAFSLKISE